MVLIHNQRQTGRHSGIVTELPPYAIMFTVRDEMLVRWRTFPDQASASAAVGLDA